MGRLRRLAGRLKRAVSAVRDEARHPGRPPGPKAADDPFWDGDVAERAAPDDDPQPAKPDEEPPAKGASKPYVVSEDVPWYLADGEDVDGWDKTNAKDESE